jgi:glucose/arabinose dehydrogenase
MSRKVLSISLINLLVSILLMAAIVERTTPGSYPLITLTHIAGGFESPVHITHAGDNSGRLFVVEQRGRIQELDNGIFLDISDRVRSPFSDGGNEEGLLSLAFPPGYGFGKDHFYVYYTRTDGNNQVSRFSLSGDPDIADPNSEETIITLDHPTYSNHNGGQLFFGDDGFLYISTGDGGGGGDPDKNGQDTNSLLGKLLRIDVEAGVDPYQIPPSNPFVGEPDHRGEIWSLGLRNPWRFSFDRLTGDLYLGDVGQGSWEEVDFQPAGSLGGTNYGWNIKEGLECYNAANCNDQGMTDPVFVYPTHVNGTCSITGGYVYRGQDYPGLYGSYIYGDYCNGNIWRLNNQAGEWANQLLLDTSLSISTFGEDENGELYLADISTGDIYQVVQVMPMESIYIPFISND